MRLPTRIALIGVAALALTVAVVALLTYQIVRVSGRQDIDRLLRQERDELAASFPTLLTEAELDGLTEDELRRAAQQYLAAHPGGERHLTALSVAGDTFTTSDGPPRLVELRDDDRLPTVEPRRLTTVDTGVGPVRALSVPLIAGGQNVGTAVVYSPLDDVRDDALASLGRVAATGLVGLALGALALTVSTRRALRPVADLAATARRTRGGDLSARATEPERHDELGELAREFNRMLDRIGADAEERKRLVAAVSHELRTPLAVARGHLELFETLEPGDALAAGQVAATTRAELDRLARIVDDLAAVAHGADDTDVVVGPVFAPDVIEELRERVAGLGLGGVRIDDAPPVVIEADQQRLAQSLLNLVVNATTHTPDGTAVQVSTRVESGTAGGDGRRLVLAVSDDGPGIDPAVRDLVFEPFVTTRVEGSKRGRGLGLAVVRTLTEAQGGLVQLTTGTSGTTVSISLRLAT
jgi:signal transduction histidine kinase